MNSNIIHGLSIKIIKLRLILFLDEKKTKNQYGFKSGKGMEDALFSKTIKN